MAELITVARPYAQAIFRLAREEKALTVWSERLKTLAFIAQDEEMKPLIGNPKFSADDLTQLFVSLVGETQSKELSSFIRLLSRNERLRLLPEIFALYEEFKGVEEGVKTVEIDSAFALDDAQLKELMPLLETHFSTKLKPQIKVDSALIGGIKARVGSQIFDASLRGRLDTLSDALKKN